MMAHRHSIITSFNGPSTTSAYRNGETNLIQLANRQFSDKDPKKEETQTEEEPESKEKVAEKEGEKSESEGSGSEESDEYDLSKEDIKEIKQLIIDQENEIEEYKGKILMLKKEYTYQVAENENTIKRYKAEVVKSKEFAISKFAKDLLEVSDNIDLAIKHTKLEDVKALKEVEEVLNKFEEFYKGVNMTKEVLEKVYQRHGVEKFNPIGEKFDPNLHEAMYTIPNPEKENNSIADVMRKGWKIGDRVLRAAEVGTFKNPNK